MIRTLILAAALIVLVPWAVTRPWIGALTWTWISTMTPHKLTFGFLRDAPVAAAVAGATVLGLLLTTERRMPPVNAVTLTLVAFIAWMCLTTAFAVHPDLVGVMFSKVMKIQFMIFVTMALLYTRRHIELFIWVIVLSLGFYGVKGGLFTLRHGGSGTVFGPGGFLEGNNELALALVMTIPLIFYLRSISTQKWVRNGFVVMLLLVTVSVLGSQSRGAFLAVVAMAAFLWRHNDHKLVFAVILVVLAIALFAFMPESWELRMRTILTYEQDGSAMGRINSWWMAWNLASHRFIGGGFDVTTPYLFGLYAPNPSGVRAAHSIYFQVLGEHGFPGLGLFLLLWFFTWRSASWVMKRVRDVPDLEWAGRLMGLVQVSFVGYFVGGAFLSLAYFDLPYNLMIIVVLTRALVAQRLAAAKAAAQIAGTKASAPKPATPKREVARPTA